MRAAEEFLQETSSNVEDLLLLLKETGKLVAYYRKLLEHYELDALTGLPGSNKFHDFIDGIENRAAGVGIVFFDVNGLKYYNDTKGHQAGDLLIQKASESLLHITGKNTTTFRVGGDEFVAVITGCNENVLDAVLTKWREKLAVLNASGDGIHCSIAAGAAIGADGDNISDVLKLADKRMYDEKKRMKASRGSLPQGL